MRVFVRFYAPTHMEFTSEGIEGILGYYNALLKGEVPSRSDDSYLIDGLVFTDIGPAHAIGGAYGRTAVVAVPPDVTSDGVKAVVTWVALQYPNTKELFIYTFVGSERRVKATLISLGMQLGW